MNTVNLNTIETQTSTPFHHGWSKAVPVARSTLVKFINSEKYEPIKPLEFSQDVLAKLGVKRLGVPEEHRVHRTQKRWITCNQLLFLQHQVFQLDWLLRILLLLQQLSSQLHFFHVFFIFKVLLYINASSILPLLS